MNNFNKDFPILLITNILGFFLTSNIFGSNIYQYKNSVVNIISYQQSFDWQNPWNKKNIKRKIGLAAVVKIETDKNNNNLFLITTADLVKNSTHIEAFAKNDMYPTKMLLIEVDHALNLALIGDGKSDFFNYLNHS